MTYWLIVHILVFDLNGGLKEQISTEQPYPDEASCHVALDQAIKNFKPEPYRGIIAKCSDKPRQW